MKVLLVEDDENLTGFLVRLFREEGFEVVACATGREGLEAAAACDILVLDWMLPDIEGIDVCRQVRGRAIDTPILMLTARGEVGDKVAGLDTGADDYLTKPFEVEELLARIRGLLRRTGAPTVTVGPLRIEWRKRRAWIGTDQLELTTREFDLLACLASRPATIVTRPDLLRQVWGLSRDPGTKIIEVHVSRLRSKLGFAAPLLETVRGGGYRLTAAPGAEEGC